MRGLAIVVALGVLAGSAGAAVRALNAMATDPSRERLTIDAAGPLFAARGLQPGDRITRCITVRGADWLDFFTEGGEKSPLAPHLHVRVFDGCHGDDVLFAGTLADARARGRGQYRIEVTVLDSAPQAARATATFGFGEPLARCTTLRAPRGGKLVRRQRVNARVSATLMLRTLAANRIVLTTGLRVRGKTLAVREWAIVAYRVNGGPAQRLGRRPFRLRSQVTALHTGRNVVEVSVRPRRGRTVTARFGLDVAARRATTCEVIA